MTEFPDDAPERIPADAMPNGREYVRADVADGWKRDLDRLAQAAMLFADFVARDCAIEGPDQGNWWKHADTAGSYGLLRQMLDELRSPGGLPSAPLIGDRITVPQPFARHSDAARLNTLERLMLEMMKHVDADHLEPGAVFAIDDLKRRHPDV